MLSTQDLLEMASLDAMGLLDIEERESFERAFRAASPAVQAQVRREQLRLSRLDDVLPAVDPPIGLRARVLSAVRDAISTVSPIKINQAAPSLRPTTGVHRFWRAAAMGTIAATMVFGFFALRVHSDYQALQDTMSANSTSDMFMREFGPWFDGALFDPSTKVLAFNPDAGAVNGRAGKAVLLIDPANGKAQLLVKNLPATEGLYEVVITTVDGVTLEPSTTFQAQHVGIKRVALQSINIENVRTIAIRKVGESQAMLVARVA